MLKKMILAAVPMMLLATIAVAEDNFLADLDVASIQDADIAIEEAGFDVDFDSLSENAGGDDEAIEACFRSFGYHGWGHRYYGGCYNYGYNYGYNYCYRPVYYSCYTPVYYHTCYPVYRNYWGCW